MITKSFVAADTIFFTLSIFCMFISCNSKNNEPLKIIATIDNEIITLDDFHLFYELDPNFGIDSVGYNALLDELHKYIDHSLAYRLASKEGLTNNSLFITANLWERKHAMLRQLYRNNVESQIDISEAELRDAYLKYSTKLHVRHLFTTDGLKAKNYYFQLNDNISTFEDLASKLYKDSVLSKNGGDLGWITAGDLDDNFSDEALKLKLNEISEPVKTQWGYHIIQVLGREDQVILTEADFEGKRHSLRKRIEQKRSRKLANEYITNFMRELNPQPVPENFHFFWNSITPPNEQEKYKLPFNTMFSNELVDKVKKDLKFDLNKKLITYHNGSVSIGEYLDGLKRIPVSNRPRFKNPEQLSNHLGIWIRDELLYQQALKEGLENHPRIQKEISEYLNQQSYLYFLQREMQQIVVPDEVRRFFESKDLTVLDIYPELEHFNTLQEWIWSRAEKNLHQVLKMINATITIDFNMLREENKLIDWKNRIRMFAIRKPS